MSGARRRHLPPLVGLLAAAVALSGSVSGAVPTAEAVAAVASAQGGRFTFSVPGFAVVEEVIDGGGPLSQAAIDAGGATGFASLPYPGESAIAFPGLFNAVTGKPFPGAYPFYVVASHPTQPEQELADPTGTYRLWATAADGQADALAQLAGATGYGADGGSNGSQALATVGREGDTVTAVAETRNEALQFGGGALRIASVRSRSSTTFRPGQSEPVTETELVIEGGSAGGYTFGYGPAGLMVAGQGVPIPAGQGLAQLNSVLAPAGLTLRIVGGEPSDGGASADALEITFAGAVPIPGMPPGVIRLRLGGASSSIGVGQSLGLGETSGDFGGDVTPPLPDSSPAATADGVQPSDDPAAAGPAPTAAQPADMRSPGGFGSALGSGVIPVHQPAAVLGGDALPAAPTGSPQSADAVTSAAVPIVQPRRLGADGFLYGALLLAAIAGLVVAGLWRGKGVVAK